MLAFCESFSNWNKPFIPNGFLILIMGGISKTFALILILIIAISSLSLLMVKPANAQTIPKPSVPEFTLKLVAHPYDVAPITTIDPYTGKTVITQEGYHVENKSIEVQVKNQPFSYSFNGTTYHLYYSFRVKGHFENIWTDYSSIYDGISYAKEGTIYAEKAQYTRGVLQSNSDYTLLTIPSSEVPDEGQLDIQVKVAVGHDSKEFANENYHIMDPTYYGHYETATAVDLTSDWSNIGTLTIPNGSVSISTSASPNPTPTSTQNPTLSPTPTVPEFSWLAILPLFISLLFIAIKLRHRSQKQS
jgi:hypothetical protein